MDFSTQEKIDNIVRDGYTFKFGKYISDGASLFQKKIGLFVAFLLVYFIAILIVSSVPVIGQIATSILGPVLLAGLYLFANKVHKGEDVEFGDFFGGFKFTKDIAIAAILISLIVLGLYLVPLLLIIGPDTLLDIFYAYQEYTTTLDPFAFNAVDIETILNRSWLILLAMIPAIYFTIAYYWSYLFIIFYGMPAWEAMEASRKVVGKQWFIIFLFLIVTGLLAGLGVLGFLVGILFTIPIMLCAIYASFADVTNLNLERNDDIVEHLVD